MKVVTPQQMSEMERKAYHLGLNEESFMDAAGLGVANVVDDFVNRIGLERNVSFTMRKRKQCG